MIGVVGDEVGTVTERLETAGVDIYRANVDEEVDSGSDGLLAVGAEALTALIEGGSPTVPVLAVETALGFPETGEVVDAARSLGRGDYTTVEHPVFGVTVGDEHAGNAVVDVMVVTSDPGSISEFRIVSGTEIGEVRADGVVVATPAGSHGYARSAGGPRLRPGVDAASVVPVAAFSMSSDRWVVGLDTPVEITSERDVPVSLLVDHERRHLRPNRTVTVSAVDAVNLVVPDDPG